MSGQQEFRLGDMVRDSVSGAHGMLVELTLRLGGDPIAVVQPRSDMPTVVPMPTWSVPLGRLISMMPARAPAGDVLSPHMNGGG